MNSRASSAGFVFLFAAVAVAVIVSGPRGGSAPTVLSTLPQSGAISVTLNASVSGTFSDRMSAASIATTTFTLTSGASAITVPGKVIYAEGKATFWPSAPLLSGTRYDATITTSGHSVDGAPLEISHSWSFTTGDSLRSDLSAPAALRD